MDKQWMKAFLRDQQGSTLAVLAASMAMVVGFTSLAVDGGYLYALRSQLQATADAAALAAVTQLPDESAALATALEYAGKNMSTASHGTVLANTDVSMGNWASDTRTFTPAGTPVNAVQVITRRSATNGNAAPTFFARVLGFDTVDIVTEGTATQVVPDEFCLLALDSISMSGDSRTRLRQCGLAANSESSSALHMTDGSELEAESVAVVGDILQEGGSQIDSTNDPETDSKPALDPFASLDVPSFSGCGGGTNLTVTSDTTLSPGVYCGGLHITNNATVTLQPGEYIIDGGDFVMDGISDVEGNEVVIFLTSSGASSDIGSLSITAHSRLDVTAPTSGPYKDLSIYQDRNAPPTGRNEISGGSSGSGPAPELETTGFIYFPAQELYLDLDAKLESDPDNAGCGKVVASRITLRDDARIEVECNVGILTTALGRPFTRLRI